MAEVNEAVALYDVIVIGGGIIGLGTAAELTKRGYRVLILERGRCHHGTSNNSLRIMHGGVRYLQSLNVSRTLSSLRAKEELLQEYPHFVSPLRCALPLERFGMRSKYPALVATFLYRVMARLVTSRPIEARVLGGEEASRTVRSLGENGQFGVLVWEDALLSNPQGLADTLIKEIKLQGGTVQENSLVTGIEQASMGVKVAIQSEDSSIEVRGRYIVQCMGGEFSPMGLRNEDVPLPAVKWCKGFNLIVSRALSPIGIGIGGGENRAFFIVPRDQRTAIGTAYISCSQGEKATVAEAEIASFLAEFNTAAPSVALSREEVVGVDCGILPVCSEKDGRPVLWSEESIFTRGRSIYVLSTKYTTFKNVARKVGNEIARLMRDE